MKKFLLIEASDAISENTTRILMHAHHKVISAKNTEEGVELAQKEKPDMTICDVTMPILDGHRILDILSKNPETADIPFVFMNPKANNPRVGCIYREE